MTVPIRELQEGLNRLFEIEDPRERDDLFLEVYKQLCRLVMKSCVKRGICDEEVWRDIVHEALSRLLMALENKTKIQSLIQYLSVLSKNVVVDYGEKKKAYEKESRRNHERMSWRGVPAQRSSSEEAESAEYSKRVKRAIMSLPNPHRGPLYVNVLCNRDHAQLTIILRTTSEDASQRLARAKRALRKVVGAGLDPGG